MDSTTPFGVIFWLIVWFGISFGMKAIWENIQRAKK